MGGQQSRRQAVLQRVDSVLVTSEDDGDGHLLVGQESISGLCRSLVGCTVLSGSWSWSHDVGEGVAVGFVDLDTHGCAEVVGDRLHDASEVVAGHSPVGGVRLAVKADVKKSSVVDDHLD
ncbi:MAG: hypothetical protein CMH82_14475 [Nocardioides sp.]|nr:hypothetical protein [Nocardioides sp.]